MSDIPRTLVVTGGTSGLGLSVVQLFASRGYHVWILSRCQQKIDTVIKSIQQKHPTAVLHGLEMDLGEMSSVRQAVAKLKNQLSVIDVLLCNTAIYQDKTEGSLDMTIDPAFRVNYLGHFLLVHMVLSLIPSHGQICFVGCGLVQSEHHWIRQAGLPLCRDMNPYTLSNQDLSIPIRYGLSKYCLMLFAHRLAVWLQEEHFSSMYNPIAVWCIDPNLLRGTGLQLEMPLYRRLLVWWFGLWSDDVSTPMASALDILNIVEGLQTDEIPLECQFFDGNQKVKPVLMRGDDISKDVWKKSVEVLGLNL